MMQRPIFDDWDAKRPALVGAYLGGLALPKIPLSPAESIGFWPSRKIRYFWSRGTQTLQDANRNPGERKFW